jgi:hypothetical protein
MRTTQSRQLTVSVKAATQRKAPAKAVKGAKAKSAAAPGFGGPDRTLWLPNVEVPEWLDGSLPGASGLCEARPASYRFTRPNSSHDTHVRHALLRVQATLASTPSAWARCATQLLPGDYVPMRQRRRESVHSCCLRSSSELRLPDGPPLTCFDSRSHARPHGTRPLRQPTEFYQFDLDALDQNLPKNRAGGLLGKLKPAPVEVKEDALVVRPHTRAAAPLNVSRRQHACTWAFGPRISRERSRRFCY